MRINDDPKPDKALERLMALNNKAKLANRVLSLQKDNQDLMRDVENLAGKIRGMEQTFKDSEQKATEVNQGTVRDLTDNIRTKNAKLQHIRDIILSDIVTNWPSLYTEFKQMYHMSDETLQEKMSNMDSDTRLLYYVYYTAMIEY